MSKLLKFIVNLFLIAAILVAAAILVPPIAGVTTTIVDSSAMDTNLPLGSVTYSTGADVSELQPGDEILKETGSATYAYILQTCDAASGRFTAVSAANPEGQSEEISLRNTVSKVAVVVPYIGYLVMAMHSLEGIIIIALVVILMIILFILSELWKPGEEDDEEEEDDVIASGLDQDDERNGIDTDTIRAAMEDNIAAVNRSDSDDVEEVPMTRAERRAARKAKKKAEKEEKNHEEMPSEEPAASSDSPAEQAEDESANNIEETASVSESEKENEDAAPAADEVFYGGESDGALFEFPEPEEEQEEEQQESADIVSAVEQVMAGIMQSEQEPEIPALETEDILEADMRSAAVTTDEDLGNGRFRRTKRPSLEEIMEDAKNAGESPKVRRDDNTGVTVVDYTDSLSD